MISRTERLALLGSFALVLALPACGGDKAPPDGPSSSAVVAGPPVAASATASPTTPSTAASASAPAEGPLGRLAWLTGKWSGSAPDGTQMEESWSAPEGSSMRGESKATKDGKVAYTETMTVEVRPDKIVYVAAPSGQAKTDFPLNEKASQGSVALFMNLEHDWPTRIRYERVGDELKVKVQGRPGQQIVEYTMKPAK